MLIVFWVTFLSQKYSWLDIALVMLWPVLIGVMVAWTGIEHFRLGRYDLPPPANEPEDAVVCLFLALLFLFHAQISYNVL